MLLIGVLALAGCGGGENGGSGAGDRDAGERAAATDTWPLTGLPARRGADQRHPVIVVKIDNTASSAPQVGLGEADLVVEELVEGGSTRLAAFFYSRLPDVAGPVRSMRASDLGILGGTDAVVATSGAAQVTLDRIDAAGVRYVSEGSPGFYRAEDRYAPYNLMARLPDVADALRTDRPARPSAYLDFAADPTLPQGRPAAGVAAVFSGGHTTTWRRDGDAYVVTDGYTAEGEGFRADTVLILRVQVGDAGYRDPAGNPVPETKLSGEGPALLVHDGRAITARWSKPTPDATISLTDADGAPLSVPAGHTWIELVPAEGGDVTLTR